VIRAYARKNDERKHALIESPIVSVVREVKSSNVIKTPTVLIIDTVASSRHCLTLLSVDILNPGRTPYTFGSETTGNAMWQAQWQAQLQQLPVLFRQIDWPNWLAIVGTSSAISSVVVLLMQGLRQCVLRRRERRDAALDVAISLEGYARVCRAMMHRAEWARDQASRSEGGEPSKSVMLPAFLYPDSLQWRRLRHRTVAELRDFPARIHASREDLMSFAEYADRLVVYSEVALESAKGARDALTLARTTRKKYGCVSWRPAGNDADLSRDLDDFIAVAQEKRHAHVQRHGDQIGAAALTFDTASAESRIAI
jgi:hypothetical protein